MRDDIAQARLPLRIELHELVVGAGRHTMRGGEHEIARDQRAGAGIAARADDHDRGAREIAGRRRAADHGGGGQACEHGQKDKADAEHGDAMSLPARVCQSCRVVP